MEGREEERGEGREERKGKGTEKRKERGRRRRERNERGRVENEYLVIGTGELTLKAPFITKLTYFSLKGKLGKALRA